MKNKVGRYSKYLRPITLILDLLIINFLAFIFLKDNLFSLYFSFFLCLSWIIIAINVRFYEVYRFTKGISIFNKTSKQFLLFTIVCFSFSGFYDKNTDSKTVLTYILFSFLLVVFFKLGIYFLLKKYRSLFGGNIRNVMIIGDGSNAQQLLNLFNDNHDYGCKVIKTVTFGSNKSSKIEESLHFASENNIDVVYCSSYGLTKKEINKIIDYSENNLRTVKFLPENDEVVSGNQQIEYYDYIPILSLQKTYLDDPITKAIKRLFDIFFSILVIVLLLSWLIPILSVLIKLESKGPVFFKQGRPGIGENEFFCYKFRSMKMNLTTEKEASKNDPRVTRTGRFIRKTSLDEMPQFLNVLLGDMSVVGPRPHLWSQNKAYGKKINKYMMRHYVKPGITGLAQVKGYRGEIETDEDMINRINLDVFYIENWSLILDIKIIFQTVINIFKGEEKAY